MLSKQCPRRLFAVYLSNIKKTILVTFTHYYLVLLVVMAFVYHHKNGNHTHDTVKYLWDPWFIKLDNKTFRFYDTFYPNMEVLKVS